ncbi:hypothetical protein FB004_11931 [Sinorhizobium medicae]|uniref:hypothetical protein n=1 Tax=Sinorhizobium medicae TaxID=110321 RepID=UPI0011A7E595|nr:hypothetical protein [Sinorhizobium medicae]TWA15950.1 hypothetical protein FB004_11931 [Sinorhizobium medicae]
MNFGDFSSVVQLGVGLHLGTALLQIYGEIGLQPMIRSIARMQNVAEDPKHPPKDEHRDELDALVSRFEVFKIQMFKQYKQYLVANSVNSLILISILVFISYWYSEPISAQCSIIFVALSILPAPITLFCLWLDATSALRPLLDASDSLEKKMFG